MRRRAVPLVLVLGIAAIAPASPAAAQGCTTPAVPSILYSPPVAVGAGATYTVGWSESPGLTEQGYYEVERNNVTNGSTLVDRQLVDGSAASFLSTSEGNFQIRVRAVPSCDPSKASAFSTPITVSVARGLASVVFTVPPAPIFVAIGESAAGKKTSFRIENLTTRDLNDVSLASTGGYVTIRDPLGGSTTEIHLPPHTPKLFELEVVPSQVPTGSAAAFQGFLVATAPAGENADPFNITPYSFYSVKVGVADSVSPEFRINGIPTEYAFLPGFAAGQPDSGRPPLPVTIRNPGSSQLELGGTVGPELWLTPNTNWNAQPIAAAGSAPVLLTTDRAKAPAGSSLPRYTYFTVTSRNGQSARLLVQDNDTASLTATRARLDSSTRSHIVPDAVSETLDGGVDNYSRIRLGNSSNARLNAELFFTPTAADGFDGSKIKRAVVVVPANDEVTLSDPLRLVFGASRPASGQIEIRPVDPPSGASRYGSLTVTSTVFTPTSSANGGYVLRVPVVSRGEGARLQQSHVITGLALSAGMTADLVLTETSGGAQSAGTVINPGSASVVVTLSRADGSVLGSSAAAISPYGHLTLPNIVKQLGGGTTIEGARLRIAVTSGGGSVVGTLVITDPATGRGWSLGSEEESGAAAAKMFASFPQRVRWPARMTARTATATTTKYVIPSVVSGLISSLQTYLYQTSLSLSAPSGSSATTFTVTLATPLGAPVGAPQPVVVSAGRTTYFADVVKELFGILDAFAGTMFVESTDPGGKVVSGIASAAVGSNPPSLAAAVPVVPTVSQAASGADGASRPVFIEGLEQSVDPNRGTRWLLLINEISNASATALVRLYEAGNRVNPIAEKQISIGAMQQVRLDTVFAQLGLDTDERRKDRTNVMVVVQSVGGDGLVTALAVAQDNRTGDLETYLLTPTGGIPATRPSLAAPVAPAPPAPVRTRPVRRP